MCRDGVRRAKTCLELNLVRDAKGIKDFYKYTINKRKTKKKCGPAAEWGRGSGEKGHG